MAETSEDPKAAKKKRVSARVAWAEARELIRASRGRLMLGLGLLLISRLSGFVLPATLKLLIDDVIGKGKHELLVPIALAGGLATLVQAATGFCPRDPDAWRELAGVRFLQSRWSFQLRHDLLLQQEHFLLADQKFDRIMGFWLALFHFLI